MSKIKLYVTHTPNRDNMCVKQPLFYNVTAGSVFQTGEVRNGMLCDDVGDNISYKNKSYCELTTQYWAWKQEQADYYGFCHYRRFFSFNSKELTEADCGCLIYPALNKKVQDELKMDKQSIEKYVETYDFLIAKAIPVGLLQAKSVYDHYKKATELHIKDVDIFLTIIKDVYPQLSETANEYFAGKVFYPCNMFIMNKELFQQYSQMLFTILEEFENRADMSQYSREGYRTPGHLGERFLGIFYEYLKKHGNYKLGQLQMAMIENTEDIHVPEYVPDKHLVPMVLAANQNYIPILFTCVSSITQCATEEFNYEIYIFHTDINVESQKKFISELSAKNIKIAFVNVRNKVSGYALKAKEHITTETFYRFLILDILRDYPKVVYLDCDIIIRKDIAELFQIELGNNLIGAAVDPDFIGQCNGENPDTERYCRETLKLKDPLSYFQAGVLLFNVKELNKVTKVEELLNLAVTRKYVYSDQDILNVICEGKVTYLNQSWNLIADSRHRRWHGVIKSAPYYILDEYEEARKDPNIIHFAGSAKPWLNPGEDFAGEFWKVARNTVYYEQILQFIQQSHSAEKQSFGTGLIHFLSKFAKTILPRGSRVRRLVYKVYWRFK